MLGPAKIATPPVPTGATGNVHGKMTTVAKFFPSGRLKIRRQTPKFPRTALPVLLLRNHLAMPPNLVPRQKVYLVEATSQTHAESVTAQRRAGAMGTANGGTALAVSTKLQVALKKRPLPPSTSTGAEMGRRR